ncbi:uncharacterized protein FIBRA_04155 [Fibroporia radiculosa]|uniref:Endonuclease/exonuclease/phosphatase domain-containing protein n=1 Tax=Fibroporia radiculosa TaxID=599839 RepID=J4G6X4_9APHY|nr:uncharacterized protein FIBRA_04155 [Fibroporia radiculosa]CCM02078.1 predicted protein [Fibroporia radiculosa]
MPLKCSTSGSARTATKRSRESPDVDSDSESRPSSPEIKVEARPRAKKAKVQAKNSVEKTKHDASEPAAPSTSVFAPNGQPTNKVIPVQVSFPERTPGTLRIATWNICGLAAAQKKGFKYYLEAEDPDILVLTETKVNNEPADPTLSSRFPHRYWSISTKKSYAGTAVLSKIKPISVTTDLPGHPDPDSVKGRILTLEFEHCYLIGTYVVNAGQGLKTLEAKKEWNVHFTKYIRALDRKKPVIWTGDLNVAPTGKDLTNAKNNWNKTAGYTEAETGAFSRILDPSAPVSKDVGKSKESSPAGTFVDIWRKMHPEDRHYTYFSYRFNCRMKGIGWRLDMCTYAQYCDLID